MLLEQLKHNILHILSLIVHMILLVLELIEQKNVQFFVNRTLAATHTANINTDDMQMFAASVSASASGQRVTKLDYITATQNRNASELINNI